VKGGQTIILGGIIETHENETNRNVPILGDIPFLGGLFRSHSAGAERKQIIIFIRPRITG
jgi:type II secretory pathway component GspD/PulD (secretin)